jgi:5-methylcytosine-specific restriction endonuclease McrA
MRKLQDKVLVLNNSYEPIGTISVEKAMCKISRPTSTLQVVHWAKDYTRVLPSGDFADITMSASSGDYPVPSVMRLLYYVDMFKRRGQSGSKSEKIFQRDKFRCQYCNIRIGQMHRGLQGGPRIMTRNDLTLDHVIPRSRPEGITRPHNLVTACKPCNQAKANRTPEEAGMKLLTPKTLLKACLEAVSFSAHAEVYPEWKRYMFLDNEGDSNLTHIGDHPYG